MTPLLLTPPARADIAMPLPAARDAAETDAAPPPGPPPTLAERARGLLGAALGLTLLLGLVLRSRRRALE